MKKNIIALFIGIVIISCNQNADSDNAQQQEEKAVVEEVLQIDENTDYSEIGFQLMETETIGGLKLDMTVKAVEKITGKPNDITDFEYWGADGLEHQSRFYQDSTIDVNFVKLEDGSVVSDGIYIIKNTDLKTSQGIGIGSTRNDVIKAYNGQISDSSEESIVVGTIYGGIIFSLEDNQVTAVFIGAGAE